MTRYYAETPCEHGYLHGHGTLSQGRTDLTYPHCPGGRRRELTDIEIVEAEWDGYGRTYLPFSGSSTGRYAIIPIDPE